ncbi:uncharacterized protein LOC126833836 [Adelges cooleyi]|uniref:uncharacterized protein LOC126833836 n=1 Tax=Adelges cooleyi TaxID=133065 RepID=UPI00217FD8D5|nr:uncharacterized protein LOC126833836 [Adelges cooleyi]
MSRYRRSKRQRQDRPASAVHHQQPSARLWHWYNHKPFPPFVTVDQLHRYRRKEFGEVAFPSTTSPLLPFGTSDSPCSFDTEYKFRFEVPYKTAEEMSVNRRHATVPKDELQVEGDVEYSAEYAENFKDQPRERNIAARQGSHIGPFECPDQYSVMTSEQHDQYVTPVGGRRASNARPSTGLKMEGDMEMDTEQGHSYVPHPDGHRAANLRPSTGLRLDEGIMDGESEQTASYRKYPTTPHPLAEDQGHHRRLGVSVAGNPSDRGAEEMILARDSGMLLRPARSSFTVFGASGHERCRSGTVKIPSYRLEVVDCSVGGKGSPKSATVADSPAPVAVSPADKAFVVLERTAWSSVETGGNRWVKRRQRKMGTVRFFDDKRSRNATFAGGKTIQ